MHLFQTIYTSDLTESEQLYYFLQIMPYLRIPFAYEQNVSNITYFLCQLVHVSSPMTNRKWVTLLYFIAKQSHQLPLIPWPTDSKWHCFICLPGSLISSVLSWPIGSEWHYFISLPDSFINPWPTGSEWQLYLFARQSHQSCLISWTVSEWHSLIALPGCLINHDLSYD